MKLLATAKVFEGEGYEDVVLRIYSERGSTPIVVVDEGTIKSAHEIGMQVLEAFRYTVTSKYIPQGGIDGTERNAARS